MMDLFGMSIPEVAALPLPALLLMLWQHLKGLNKSIEKLADSVSDITERQDVKIAAQGERLSALEGMIHCRRKSDRNKPGETML